MYLLSLLTEGLLYEIVGLWHYVRPWAIRKLVMTGCNVDRMVSLHRIFSFAGDLRWNVSQSSPWGAVIGTGDMHGRQPVLVRKSDFGISTYRSPVSENEVPYN